MTLKPMSSWTGETWRWIAALLVGIVSGSVSSAWAVATFKHQTVAAIAQVADGLEGHQAAAQSTHVAILKEIDSQVSKQELRNDGVNRRLAELEAQAKINQAVLSSLESLKTEVRYLSNGLTELKQEIRKQ